MIEPEDILNSNNFESTKKDILKLSKDSEGEKRTDRLSTVINRLYLYLVSSNYTNEKKHSDNLISFLLLDFLPKDLTMSFYMDLLKNSKESVKLMLRDKKLANFLVKSM